MKKKVTVMTLVGVILVAVVAVGASVWSAGRDEVTEPTEVVEQLTPYEETSTEEVVESISELEEVSEENKFTWEDREVDYEVPTHVISRAETLPLLAEPREDAEVLVDLPKEFQFTYDAEVYIDNVLTTYVRVTIEPNEELGVTEPTTGYLSLTYCDTLEVYEEMNKLAQQSQTNPTTPTQPEKKKMDVKIDDGSSDPSPSQEDIEDIIRLREEKGIWYE